MAEPLPLHRSLLRAAVLAPAVAVPAAAATGALRDRHIDWSEFLLLAMAWTSWVAMLIVAGDLASAGHRLRRALVVALAPALLPFAVLCPVLQVERQPLGRAGAWSTPARALELIRAEHREAGVALLLASLLPFTAILLARARGAPRPIAAHAAVIIVSSYASLLVLEHLASDVALPLDLGNQVLLLALPGLLLVLTFLELRLGDVGEPYRLLAGRAPPVARHPVRATLGVLAAFSLALTLSTWLHPLHFAARLSRRIGAGEPAALQWDLRRPESQGTTPSRFQRALESPWAGERRAAFHLLPSHGGFGLSRSECARRAIGAARREPDPGARTAAIRCLALVWWGGDRDRVVRALGEAAQDPDPLAAAWARLGLALSGEGEHPDELLPLIAPLAAEERRELGLLLVHHRAGHTAVRLAVLALATAGDAARDDLEGAVEHLFQRGMLPEPSLELAAALARALEGRDPATIPAPLARLMGAP